MDQTAQKIQEMLTENTGRHFLDSGGAYGRNWERNQGRSFADEPEVHLEFDTWMAQYDNKRHYSLDVTVSVYHFLCRHLEYDEEMQERWEKFHDTPEHEDTGWLELTDKFVREELKAGGLYGEGEPMSVNTYNHDSLLSQVLQYTYFEYEDSTYVLLQIHGGCDVRGGYTAPVVFRTDENILCDQQATIYCTNRDNDNQTEIPECGRAREHYWWTDDGYHWYNEGTCGRDWKQLESYEFTIDENEKGKGKVYVDDDKNGYCPFCGGKLEASF